MRTVGALVGLLGGLFVAMVALSLYYVTLFKTRWKSFGATVGSGVLGLALSSVLSFALSTRLLREIFPVESAVEARTIKEYLVGFFLGGVILGVALAGRVLTLVRDRDRYKVEEGNPSEQRWFDVPPPKA